MDRVLFVSENQLGRCENLTAVWDAYDGDKEFRLHHSSMRTAEREGFDAVVFDALPVFMEGKAHCKTVNLCHGITGNKLYGSDEGDRAPWFDAEASMQTDYAIAASDAHVPMVARQLCIPQKRVLPLGFPRTDAYFSRQSVERPSERVYLYAPTFRNGDGRLPRIDWMRLDRMLNDGERLIVKRHYYMGEPLMRGQNMQRIIEVGSEEPLVRYMLSCDVLITDYSSAMFDAHLLGKPTVLLVDDMAEYIAKRGMYYPYPQFYSSRWLYVEGCEEYLVAMLREAAENGLTDTERACIETVAGACDGHSTERVCELIKNLI